MESVAEREVGYVMTDEEFYDFCQRNPEYKFEREPDGRIITMPNTGGKTGNINQRLGTRVEVWNEVDETGRTFDSSTAFRLPDGSTRSPDVAWIRNDRWDVLTNREQEQFPPICPDFVIELLSPTDSLRAAKAKMSSVWIANGCRLAWLIDSRTQTTYIFRANGEIQLVEGFNKPLSGENVLPDFTLDVARLMR